MRSWREPGEKEARAALWELMGTERPEGGVCVLVEREGKAFADPGVEDFLVHVLAAQIPADFGPETSEGPGSYS